MLQVWPGRVKEVLRKRVIFSKVPGHQEFGLATGQGRKGKSRVKESILRTPARVYLRLQVCLQTDTIWDVLRRAYSCGHLAKQAAILHAHRTNHDQRGPRVMLQEFDGPFAPAAQDGVDYCGCDPRARPARDAIYGCRFFSSRENQNALNVVVWS